MNEDINQHKKILFKGLDSSLISSDPEFADIIFNFSQCEVTESNKLSDKERMLCILATLLGCQGMGQYCNMLHIALNIKIDPVAIKEMIYQATAYLGIGRTHDYLVKTNDIMEEHGVKLPLQSQTTTDKTTRFEKGLNKQISLFGQQMADRQTKAPRLRKNINRWLASNCFGDYYTRTGLNDSEREMITFCFILAQGGCENQLKGHTAGNFNVGNDKEKLYQVIEQCMPYIGYPRTLNAMSIVDEVSLNNEKR